MSERSVQCPDCPYSFARLIDAGHYRAYRCPTCPWERPTEDRRAGNRPADVCALCDRAIDLTIQGGHLGLHLYVGPGWVHGRGAESIPIHNGCGWFEQLDHLLAVHPAWQESIDHLLAGIGVVQIAPVSP